MRLWSPPKPGPQTSRACISGTAEALTAAAAIRAEKRMVIFIFKAVCMVFVWNRDVRLELNLANCLEGLIDVQEFFLRIWRRHSPLFIFLRKRAQLVFPLFIPKRASPRMNEDQSTFSHTDFVNMTRRNEVEMISNVRVNNDFIKRSRGHFCSVILHPSQSKADCVKNPFSIVAYSYVKTVQDLR